MNSKEDNAQRKKWDETYVKKNFFGATPSDLALTAMELFQEHKTKRVLELGCGQGRDTWFFANQGLEVTALDYSETGICQMREHTHSTGSTAKVELRVCDLRKGIPLPDESVDAIYSHMLLCMELTTKEVQSILDECRRVLIPGGLNVFSVRNDHDPHYGKFTPKGEDMWENPLGLVVHFFSDEKVRRLSKGYHILRMKEFDDASPPFVRKLYEVVLEKPR